ncbi:MAG: DMT family transporter, partial [Phycisphaerales bacterium JB037]
MPAPSNPDSRWLGVVTVLATLVGWCSIPIFLRHFSHSIDPWTSNGWRYGFAALLWLPVILLGFQRRDLPKGLWKAALVPAAFNSLGQICFTYAHYQVDPALLTFG